MWMEWMKLSIEANRVKFVLRQWSSWSSLFQSKERKRKNEGKKTKRTRRDALVSSRCKLHDINVRFFQVSSIIYLCAFLFLYFFALNFCCSEWCVRSSIFFSFFFFGFSVFVVACVASTYRFQWCSRICCGERIICNRFTNWWQTLRWAGMLWSLCCVRCATAGFWAPKTFNCSRYLCTKQRRQKRREYNVRWGREIFIRLVNELVIFVRQTTKCKINNRSLESECLRERKGRGGDLPEVDNRPQWIWIRRAMHLSNR